jgi:hypothetical protein
MIKTRLNKAVNLLFPQQERGKMMTKNEKDSKATTTMTLIPLYLAPMFADIRFLTEGETNPLVY